MPATIATPMTIANAVSSARSLRPAMPLRTTAIIAAHLLQRLQDLVRGGRAEVADDVAVGQEQHAVGDRRGVRVVRDHHRRLAERVDRSRAAGPGSRRWCASRGCRSARRRTSPSAARPGRGRRRRAAAGRRRARTGDASGGRPGRRSRPRSSSHAWSGLLPASLSGSAMFSAAVSIGSRLKNWKMNPMWSRRSFVSAVSSRLAMSTPATMTSPDVGLSSPARMCMSVDLPEPDGPMTAVSCPRRCRPRRRAGRRRRCHRRRSGGRDRARETTAAGGARISGEVSVCMLPRSQPGGRVVRESAGVAGCLKRHVARAESRPDAGTSSDGQDAAVVVLALGEPELLEDRASRACAPRARSRRDARRRPCSSGPRRRARALRARGRSVRPSAPDRAGWQQLGHDLRIERRPARGDAAQCAGEVLDVRSRGP